MSTSLTGRSRLALTLVALSAAIGLACSDASGPGAHEDVASVVVTGVPQTLLLVGDSVRLVATAVNESGGAIPGPVITWKSSAPQVALVRPNGTVLAVGAGAATITASAGGQEGSVAFDVAFGATLGIEGGTLSAGALGLDVPAGALAQSTLVLARPTTPATSDARVVPGTAYTLGPDGLSFRRGVTLTLTYDPAKIPAGLYGVSLQTYLQSGTGWTVIYGSTVDTVTHTVRAVVAGSGTYIVRSTPVNHITIDGAAANGALYAGQTSRLTTRLYPTDNTTIDTLPSRPITWTSSDRSKITVDGSGNVTALAVGSATITAATDGQQSSVTVTVLPRPTADWSRATDWVTYQGDMRHSGYIDATVDPGVFKERWVSTPPAGAVFFQPTVGGGRVYLATDGYFTSQKLVALDAAAGSVVWTRDFGAIFGINQATYDQGSLYITSGGHGDTFIWALNEADGSLRFQTAFPSQWEHWKAPVVVGNVVVTAGGYFGGMYGFNRATGVQTFGLSGPQVDGWGPAVTGGNVYTTGWVSGGGVRGFDPTNGTAVTEFTDSRLAAVTTPVIGEANDLLTIIGNRLIASSLGTKSVTWEQSGSYVGMPVVGKGIVYAFGGTVVTARQESDGALLWSWSLPPGNTGTVSLALTNNVLFVSGLAPYGGTGTTVALDLATHLPVWSYPLAGRMAISAQGVLYVTTGSKVAAVSLR